MYWCMWVCQNPEIHQIELGSGIKKLEEKSLKIEWNWNPRTSSGESCDAKVCLTKELELPGFVPCEHCQCLIFWFDFGLFWWILFWVCEWGEDLQAQVLQLHMHSCRCFDCHFSQRGTHYAQQLTDAAVVFCGIATSRLAWIAQSTTTVQNCVPHANSTVDLRFSIRMLH